MVYFFHEQYGEVYTMARPSKRVKIRLTNDELQKLKSISASRTEEIRRVQRAKIILMNVEGMGDTAISRELKLNRLTVRRCLEKCITMGVEAALSDLPRSGAPIAITQEEKAWIVFLACENPTSFNYSYELWTITLLLAHIHKHAEEKGFYNLTKLARSKLWTILNETEIKPHKVKYYLEKRDPEFETKTMQLLMVYKEIEIANQKCADENKSPDKISISYDEKPGIQAIGNTAPDLMPSPYIHSSLSRDHEYERHGTVSLLAGINLHDGKVTAIVRESHKSADFIEFLKKLDIEHPKEVKIRLILDNNSAHISKETRGYLDSVPNRFEFVFTPTHGSWLNLIESFFSKMARTFLRGIRVSNKEELYRRIYEYIDEVNQSPVVFRWKYKMDEIVV